MYAIRRKYVKQWEHIKPENQYSVTVTKGGKPVPYIKSERISVIEEEMMYWRKANHIHQWFVDNVQDGDDDCGVYSVSKEKLLELFDLCETIMASAERIDKAGDGPATTESNEGSAEASSRLTLKDDTVARLLLPRQEGFFFGSQAYDEDYMFDIRETRDWLIRLFDEAKLDPWALDGISYHSSW